MVARVLGIRLLTVDVAVVLRPAEVPPRAALPPVRRAHQSVAAGRSLAEAARQIDEGAALLAATRNGASPAG